MSSNDKKPRIFNDSGNSSSNNPGLRGLGTTKITKDKFNESKTPFNTNRKPKKQG